MTCTFKQHDQLPIYFGNEQLTDVESHKHLGLTLSSRLTWSAHIVNIAESVSSMVDVLKRLKYDLDRKSIETIYFSFIRPKLEYACHVWNNCSIHEKEILENIQLDVARAMTGARKGTSHNEIYKETNWQTLSERRKALKLKYFLKVVHHETPEYMQSLLPDKIGASRLFSNT